MKTLKDAIEIIMAEPPELHYPAYFVDLLREADVPGKDVGKCSEIPNSSDLSSIQQAIDLLDEQITICDRALTNPGIAMNDEFAVNVEKRSLIAYREKLECLLSTEPEIIRCKDCKWWDKTDGPFGYCMAMKHGYMSANWEIGIYRRYKGDFYCADAERRTDETD